MPRQSHLMIFALLVWSAPWQPENSVDGGKKHLGGRDDKVVEFWWANQGWEDD